MKRIKLLLLTALSLFAVNSIVFAQQDTTLTVTSDGKVGIGTTSPAANLHIYGTTTLGLRITRGDVSGAIDLHVADGGYGYMSLGGGTQLRGNGRQSTFDGRVGIGTTSPAANLHILGTTSLGLKITRSDTSGAIDLHVADGGYGYMSLGGGTQLRGNGRQSTFDGRVGIGTTSPSHPLEMASGAHVTAGGVWTDASSRELKENIRDLTGEEAARALSQLAPKRYNYKAEKSEEYLGFIAEDVPGLVATNDRKSLSPMDIVAVLTRVVQEQQEKIAELEARLNSIQ